MRAGGRILIIFGLVLGIVAAAAVYFILSRSSATEEGAAAEAGVPVVVAFQVIEPWQEISAEALGYRPLPQAQVDTSQAILQTETVINEETGESEEVEGTQFVSGKLSNSRIYPGQIIVKTQLVDKTVEEQRLGLGSTASYIIPDGEVAIAIAIDTISSVAGALQAGDQVDILATVNVSPPGSTILDEALTLESVTYLLQQVQILRVGPWTAAEEGGEGGGGIVTIIVEPQQAAELKWIQENTAWQFVLRSITDEADHTIEPVTDEYMIQQYSLPTP